MAMESSRVVHGFSVYEFDIPQELSGRLLGKKMKHVKTIKDLHNAFISIERHPFDIKLKTVRVEGSRASVLETLEFLRMKVPLLQFPTVTFAQTNKRHSQDQTCSPLNRHTQSENKVLNPDEMDMESSGVGFSVYEFDIPQELSGRLLGKHMKHVKTIKDLHNAFVSIKRHPFDIKLRTVRVKGSPASILETLEFLRMKVPPSKFPTVTFTQTNKRHSQDQTCSPLNRHAPASKVHKQSENKVSDPDEMDMESSGVVPGQFVYEFDFPKKLCGLLIGKNRENLRKITERTNAFVSMKAHSCDPKLKSVLVKGSHAHVLNAIECLRVKFPPSKFPVTFIQTNKIT